MSSLEDDIEMLSELDTLRVRSATLRNEGRKALLAVLNGELAKGWEEPGEPLEDGLLFKALCYRGAEPLPPRMITQLESATLAEVVGSESAQIPVLRAARALQALVSAPDSAFSTATLFLYYRIVREIYSADSPDWSTGGVRAGEGGVVTAFVTGECVRAILGFARTLEQTGNFVAEISRIKQQKGWAEGGGIMPDDWCKAEAERLETDFFITIKSRSGNIALRLEQPLSELKIGAVIRFLNNINDDLGKAVRNAVGVFGNARAELEEYRKSEPQGKRFQRSQIGHLIANSAVEKAEAAAIRALKLFQGSTDPLQALAELAGMFAQVAYEVRRLLIPSRGFLSAILDRELAAASGEGVLSWDPGEMAFAAASYGFLTEAWDDERLRRAGHYLSRVISDRGRFPVGRPIYSMKSGFRMHVANGEIIRAFCQLLQNVPSVGIDPKLIGRLLRYFLDTREQQPGVVPMSGWHSEEPRQPPQASRCATAIAVLALDRINRMLDERINGIVFRHFSTKQPQELPVNRTLQSLFYGDYGLRRAPDMPEDGPLRREGSVAILLERMRAHVLGVRPARDHWNPLYSMVLHGPPGTGKTTFLEALALSCNVPLLEVTPSDIVVGGEDAIERQARAVFKALSLLTRVVIIFDEFDPVLRRRDPTLSSPSTVFSFLTPGMLPKLKTLNLTAGRRGVAYGLVTNLIGSLDEASVRSGRFDCRVGIYPPDLLSRAGRLWSEILEFEPAFASSGVPQDFVARVEEVIRRTAGKPMQALGKTGWFTRPENRDLFQEGTPFFYIFQKGAEPRWPDNEATLQCVLGDGATAKQEYRQWAWIELWDKSLEEGKPLGAALAAPPAQVPPLKWPKRRTTDRDGSASDRKF